MLELGSELDLPPKPVEHDRTGQIGGKDLEDYFPVKGDFVCKEYSRHAATTELSLDCVPGTKRGLELESELVGQVLSPVGAVGRGTRAERYRLVSAAATPAHVCCAVMVQFEIGETSDSG